MSFLCLVFTSKSQSFNFSNATKINDALQFYKNKHDQHVRCWLGDARLVTNTFL